MNIRKSFSVIALMLAFAFMPLVLHADADNQATKFTFSQPVQIPGRVLPAGTYWFQLLNTPNRQVVQVLAEDGTPIAMLLTLSRERPSGNDPVAVTLADRGPGQPEAIVAWYYVGDTDGHQFLYPKQQARELAHEMQKTVVAGD
jgi:Protein of unknown function (DUF2911)